MTIIKKKEQNKNETNHKQWSQSRPFGWFQASNKTVSGWTGHKSDGSTIVITPTTWGKLPNLVQWTKTWNSVTKCLCVISRNNNHQQHNHSHNHGGGQHERDIEGSVWKEDVGGCRGVWGEEERKRKKRKTVFENNFQSLTHFSIPIDNHFNNSSINPHSISLSLWMKTQTHTQLINIYHTNHHQSISSTTTIHVHSFSFHKQHTQSLSKQSFLFSILKINLFLPSLSFISFNSTRISVIQLVLKWYFPFLIYLVSFNNETHLSFLFKTKQNHDWK